jgi:hypothetical protein
MDIEQGTKLGHAPAGLSLGLAKIITNNQLRSSFDCFRGKKHNMQNLGMQGNGAEKTQRKSESKQERVKKE